LRTGDLMQNQTDESLGPQSSFPKCIRKQIKTENYKGCEKSINV
jgi:hypothetical protein